MMALKARNARVGGLSVQFAVGLAALAFIALAPPTEGMMLLMPLAPSEPDAVAAVAVANGARLVELGPIFGSVVVWGRSGDLEGPLLQKGIIVLAGSARGCQSTPS